MNYKACNDFFKLAVCVCFLRKKAIRIEQYYGKENIFIVTSSRVDPSRFETWSMELVLPGKNRVEKKKSIKVNRAFYDSQTDNDLYMCGNVTIVIKTLHIYV